MRRREVGVRHLDYSHIYTYGSKMDECVISRVWMINCSISFLMLNHTILFLCTEFFANDKARDNCLSLKHRNLSCFPTHFQLLKINSSTQDTNELQGHISNESHMS